MDHNQNKPVSERDFSEVKEDEVNDEEEQKDDQLIPPPTVKYMNEDEIS